MKSATMILVLWLFLLSVSGIIACNSEELAEPMPTPAPSFTPTSVPTSTVTPQAINWGVIAVRVNQLASEKGLTIYEVKQLTDDIAEVAVNGECTSFANAIDEEPNLEILGSPQLDDQGICTLWFRVLSH